MRDHRRAAMIEAVVFDVGGVLCPSPLNEFIKVDREYSLPEGTVMSLMRGGDDFALCETGQLPVFEFYDRCVARIAKAHDVQVPPQRLDAMLEACIGKTVRPEMIDLVIEIKAAGYQTALLTNIFAERRNWLHAMFPHGTIDVFGDSSELGMRKPDLPIYRRLIEMLGRLPGEIAFIDDFAENLVPARSLGIVDILFESPEQVRQDLVRAGVTIAAR
jgi:epoxide hydrolase-like predicted phosphatase